MYSFSQSPDLRRLTSYTSSVTSSPVRATESRRSRQLASSQAPLRTTSIDGFRAYQEHVSSKLNELHAKVNVVLSRSGSPVRPTRITTEPTETPKTAAVPYHIGEAYAPSKKVAQNRPSSAPRSFSFSQQSGSFSNNAYTDYVLDIKRCEGSRNFYDQEIAKKANPAPVKRPSVEISSGGSSPIKSALRSKSINRTWSSIPNEQEGDKRSSRMNSSMLGGSPVKVGGKTVTWSPNVGGGANSFNVSTGSQKDTLYDKDKLNQIMARIAVRQAMESRSTLESAFDKKSFLYAPSYGNSISSKLQTQAGPYKL